mmetsp:Transcript_58780/g.136761  ORF Transcript_58780/g.136761 Transcript_58780/m.136761 type:complete len:200 (-) Transcript_58780:287-886(-)
MQPTQQVVEENHCEHVRRRPLGDQLHRQYGASGERDQMRVLAITPELSDAQQQELQARHNEGKNRNQDCSTSAIRLPEEPDKGPRRLMNWAVEPTRLSYLDAVGEVRHQDLDELAHLRLHSNRFQVHIHRNVEAEILAEEPWDQDQVACNQQGEYPAPRSRPEANGSDQGHRRQNHKDNGVDEPLPVDMQHLCRRRRCV